MLAFCSSLRSIVKLPMSHPSNNGHQMMPAVAWGISTFLCSDSDSLLFMILLYLTKAIHPIPLLTHGKPIDEGMLPTALTCLWARPPAPCSRTGWRVSSSACGLEACCPGARRPPPAASGQPANTAQRHCSDELTSCLYLMSTMRTSYLTSPL